MMRLANHRRMALFSPKIRSKVGSIVCRSRSVSLTSKTIRGSSAISKTPGMEKHSSAARIGMGQSELDRFHLAAIDAKLSTGHPSCGPRDQKGHQFGDILRLSIPADAGLREERLLCLIGLDL